jgi:hypothetical protein
MSKKFMDHEDAMELAVQLTCSYLGTSHSGSTDAEDLIYTYYRQIRNVETRLNDDASHYRVHSEAEEEEEELAAA